jgi:predicted MFS family arabinose efflux permease
MLGMSALMGARGIGALLGPLISTRIAGQTRSRQRIGILIGFLLASVGYFGLNPARSIAEACLAIIIGHAGSSIVWVFSTTLLQAQTEDRFRGRVFSAEFACMAVMMSLVSGLAGFLIDEGMHPQSVATWIGVIVLGPAFLWWRALRLWKGHRDASTI